MLLTFKPTKSQLSFHILLPKMPVSGAIQWGVPHWETRFVLLPIFWSKKSEISITSINTLKTQSHEESIVQKNTTSVLNSFSMDPNKNNNWTIISFVWGKLISHKFQLVRNSQDWLTNEMHHYSEFTFFYIQFLQFSTQFEVCLEILVTWSVE